MSFDKKRKPGFGQIGVVTDPEDQPGRFARLRSHGAVILGAVLLGVLLVVFGNFSSRATPDGVEAAAQSQNESLSVRAYQFTGQGKLQGGSGEAWIVGGVPVVVNGDTQFDGDIHPADSLSLLAHITKNGKWVAERVVPIAEQESFFSFAGPLEARDQNIWQVAGFPLLVSAQTQLGEAIPDNELVLATFKVLEDGTWLALQIEALSALEASRTPTPTVSPSLTPTPTAKPAVPTKKLAPAKSDKSKPSNDKHDKKKPPKNKDKTVTICHKPNDKKGGETKIIGSSALSSHLGHGDILGPCH